MIPKIPISGYLFVIINDGADYWSETISLSTTESEYILHHSHILRSEGGLKFAVRSPIFQLFPYLFGTALRATTSTSTMRKEIHCFMNIYNWVSKRQTDGIKLELCTLAS